MVVKFKTQIRDLEYFQKKYRGTPPSNKMQMGRTAKPALHHKKVSKKKVGQA
jgi:hypothetical protein